MNHFWDSMTASQEIPVEARNTEDWNLVEHSFDSWNPGASVPPGIPRIVHQIWLGSPLPNLYARWGDSWRRKNPGWEYRLWTEREIDAFGLRNRLAYEKSPNFGVKSDLARYEILERLGGVYADTDFECLGSFESLSRSSSFFAGIMYGSQSPTINNGLIGSVPGHPVLRAMISVLKEPFAGHDPMDILAYSGPIRFASECLAFLKTENPGAVILPTSYFYPFPNRDIEMKDLKTVKSWARPESLAVHYWEVSWRRQSLTSRVYWWMRKSLPPSLFVLIYTLVKGKRPQ